MTAHRFALVPRDGLFCKDGRGWYSNGLGRGHGLAWPFPSTVLGALRTAFGRAVEAKEQRVFTRDDWTTATQIILGPSVALRRRLGEERWKDSHRLWPVPADALFLQEADEVNRLAPVAPTVSMLGRDDAPARERLWRPDLLDKGKPETAPPWWPEEAFVTWLAGGTLTKEDGKGQALTKRLQVHVAIDPGLGTAKDGALYSRDILETLQKPGGVCDHRLVFEWAIAGVVTAPETFPPPASPATLGGSGGLAWVEPIDEAVFTCPNRLIARFAERPPTGLRLVAVTPLIFDEGWLPDGFVPRETAYYGTLPGVEGDLILRAAFVPRPLAVGGWDMATGKPKRTQRLVPPGAVYFFERVDRKPFTPDQAQALWCTALGHREHTSQGFGRVVPGIWQPKDQPTC